MSASSFYHITRKGKFQRLSTADEALTAAKEGGSIWLNFCQPAREELAALMEPLGLDALSVEDCFDENQIPKIDDFPRYSFLLFNAFDASDRQLVIAEIDVFLGENYLITVSRPVGMGKGPLDGIERIVELNLQTAAAGPSHLLYLVLNYLVDRKFLAIEVLSEDLDAREEALLADVGAFNPADLVQIRRDLLSARKSLFHEREILVKISRRDSPFIAAGAIFHFRDVYDHLNKSFELIESYRDVVTSLMEMYLSLLNNQMTRAANDTNVTVRRLTFITTIFMPLTLLAGIGGMSEYSMMTGPANWTVAYPLFFVAMAVIGLANYFVLRRFEGFRDRSSGNKRSLPARL